MPQKRRKKKAEQYVEVWEIWAEGRHYLRLPNGQEIDVPKLEKINPDDYIFRNGDGS